MIDRKVIAIAGASSGSGKAMAEILAAAGYPVALAARRGTLLEDIAASITAAGGGAPATSSMSLQFWASGPAPGWPCTRPASTAWRDSHGL